MDLKSRGAPIQDESAHDGKMGQLLLEAIRKALGHDDKWSCDQRASVVRALLATAVAVEQDHLHRHGADLEDGDVTISIFESLTDLLGTCMGIEIEKFPGMEMTEGETKH